MKRLLSLSVFLMMALLSFAHDFEVVNADGVTIYYNITSSYNLTVAVTYRGTSYSQYSNEYTGAVNIPATVTYNEKTYSVTRIGDFAFYNCSSLTYVTIPSSVTRIGSNAFEGCSGLTSVTIPNSVTSIGSIAFWGCSSLTSVTIPNSVTSIGGYAFYKCSGLTSVTIPSSVTSIGVDAFYGCSGLKKVIVPDIAAWCKISFGIDAANPLCYAKHIYSDENTEITDLVIPNGVTSIGYHAFDGCSGLTSVNIPNSVTSIGSSAFRDCSGLTSVTIPNSVTYIGSWAFDGCSSLTSIEIPNSVTFIGADAFSGTAWYNNQPEGLIYLGKVAYKYKGTMPKNTVIDLEEGTTEIASKAFYNCTGLTSITIPNSVTSIGSQAFYGCSGLASVTIPNSVTSIGSYAFDGCSGLSTVILPDDLVSIGYNTFPKKSTTRLYVNIGSKTLLALWNEGYDYVYDDIETQNRLQPSSSLYLSSSTQTSLTINIDSKYSGYTFTCDGNNIGSGGITKTGLYPGQSQSFSITVKKDDLSHSFSEEFRTKDIAPIVSGIVSASSIKATGSYTKGDAVVTKTVIKCNGKEIEGDNLSVCGLTPNKSYTVDYIITVQGNKTYEDSKTFKTSELTMTTEQPKVVSVGNVIVSAKANVDDAETNVGFEWRRTDWTDEFKSNTGTAYMYEGTMEGYIRNLYAEKLWKFRPYYLADDGTYYYGDWMGLDPTNTSYFEPTVHTYANINIEGNTALVKGYALGGTDKITVQGFKYWKAANLAPSGDLALEARKASPAIPADAQTIEAEGRVMEATLSGLDYECTYSYVAFAKTEEGTFYGDIKTFTTGPNTTGIEVVRDADSETKAVDDKVKGIYTLTGVKLSDDAAGLKMLKRGIYIVNGRKVAVK